MYKTVDKRGSSASGTSTAVPIDISGDSCTVVGGVEVCTATSTLNISSGRSSGGPFTGPFTGQGITQTRPVAGAGCSFAPTTIAACTIGSTIDGCKYEYTGGAEADRSTTTGDIAASYTTGGTLCLDGTTFAYQATETFTSAGGSGKFASITAEGTATASGQIMLFDGAGNGFGWFTSTLTGTETVN